MLEQKFKSYDNHLFLKKFNKSTQFMRDQLEKFYYMVFSKVDKIL